MLAPCGNFTSPERPPDGWDGRFVEAVSDRSCLRLRIGAAAVIGFDSFAAVYIGRIGLPIQRIILAGTGHHCSWSP